MSKMRITAFGVLLFLLAGFVLLGCSEDVLIGKKALNKKPEVWLSSGPVEGDTTGYQVHFYWGGWDPDGEIDHFEFVVADGNPFGFNPADTTGSDKWFRTSSHDSTIKVSADNFVQDTTFAGSKSKYAYYDRTHTFFIRAVDKEGMESNVQYRSFTAWTLAPTINVDKPARSQSSFVDILSQIVTFSWTGSDPIDMPNNSKDPDSIRYLLKKIDRPDSFIVEINRDPLQFEDLWSKWIWYRAPEDSGKSTIVGDDEALEINSQYVFAVQAKDDAGAVSAIFDPHSNLRFFIVSKQAGPNLLIKEPYLGAFRFLGLNISPKKKDLPPGVALNFSWKADASKYGGSITGYSYGWDVSDINNPNDWEEYRNPMVKAAPEKIWYSGVHTFFVEAVDNAGTVTLGQIEINIVPFTMSRSLLWIDDYLGASFQPPDYSSPSELNHDNFWIDLCSKAEGFDSERDVYDVQEHIDHIPEISLISQYKNIIWIYSSSDVSVWDDLVKYTPEDMVAEGQSVPLNYIPIFLAKGGHIMTAGASTGLSGLAAVIPGQIAFPTNLKCEIKGTTLGCDDTSGVNSMTYSLYCVTMLDKVSGTFRTDDPSMPRRIERKFDVLRYAYKANDDSITAGHSDIPEILNLWDQVTKPGSFFDPNGFLGGFNMVEIYDPQYWMDHNYAQSQPCFHPLYRMKAYNSMSVLNDGVVALWVTKYEDVVPDVESGVGVAAPSIHFGFPLWYFDHDSVSQIMDMVFSEWGILKSD